MLVGIAHCARSGLVEGAGRTIPLPFGSKPSRPISPSPRKSSGSSSRSWTRRYRRRMAATRHRGIREGGAHAPPGPGPVHGLGGGGDDRRPGHRGFNREVAIAAGLHWAGSRSVRFRRQKKRTFDETDVRLYTEAKGRVGDLLPVKEVEGQPAGGLHRGNGSVTGCRAQRTRPKRPHEIGRTVSRSSGPERVTVRIGGRRDQGGGTAGAGQVRLTGIRSSTYRSFARVSTAPGRPLAPAAGPSVATRPAR